MAIPIRLESSDQGFSIAGKRGTFKLRTVAPRVSLHNFHSQLTIL